MNWYYAQDSNRQGPFDDAAFAELVKSGQVTPETLVWREGLPEWQPYRRLTPVPATSTEEGEGACVECGRTFPKNEMVQFEGSWICPNCKPVFFQRVREGIATKGDLTYAGFWIRFLAKFIDGIILQVVGLGLRFLGQLVISPTDQPGVFFIVLWVVSTAIGASYSTYFVGKFGATPGKMACRLKVIMADESQVSYLRALGRYFAEILSYLIMAIGYIMAAFDEEKRTLHDRICDTRVIRLNA